MDNLCSVFTNSEFLVYTVTGAYFMLGSKRHHVT